MTGYKKHQSGVALMIGLVMLLLLTIIMVAAMRVTELEETMAGNSRNQNIAFQAAESALREAEALIDIDDSQVDLNGDGTLEPNPFNPLKLSNGPFQNTTAPACVAGICGTTSPLQSANISSATGKQSATTGITGLHDQPKYMIEFIGYEPSVDSSRVHATFRVTTLAWAKDGDNTLVQLQSTYRLHALSFVH